MNCYTQVGQDLQIEAQQATAEECQSYRRQSYRQLFVQAFFDRPPVPVDALGCQATIASSISK